MVLPEKPEIATSSLSTILPNPVLAYVPRPTGAAALPLAATLNALGPISTLSAEDVAAIAVTGPTPKIVPLSSRLAPADPANLSWQQKIRRVGQSNMTEHDPAVMNIEEWADYWHSAATDIVFVSVTGILAFYPSNVKFHRHGKFLNGRDFFGECLAAAKKRGMQIGRASCRERV